MATEDLLRDAFAHVDAQREAFIQRLLDYVRKTDVERYRAIIAKLGLRR